MKPGKTGILFGERGLFSLFRFVECLDCGRRMHQICVLHHETIWPSGYELAFVFICLIIVDFQNNLFSFSYLNLSPDSFVCDGCLKKTNKTRKENKYCAKSKFQYFLWFHCFMEQMSWQNLRWQVINFKELISFLSLASITMWFSHYINFKASEDLLNIYLVFSHRVAPDKVGLFPGDQSEWLLEASKQSRVWRCDYSCCSCLWQSSGGETRNEIQVWGWKMPLNMNFNTLDSPSTVYCGDIRSWVLCSHFQCQAIRLIISSHLKSQQSKPLFLLHIIWNNWICVIC